MIIVDHRVANPDFPGKAYTGNMCENGKKCAVSADYGMRDMTTPSHEVGHR